MAYAALADMILTYGERELVQATDRADPPAGLIDQTVLGQALDHADGLIDGYLRTRYALPLAGIHPMLKGLAQDIAWWRLFREPTEEIRRRYDAAVATLKQLASGAIKLPDEAGLEPVGLGDSVVMTGEDRLFSRGRMRGL